ncbi:MAG: hypothetical protein L3K19_09585 [Thermoplasmata archaeon]|nr:hypothetical protein [Thermoplasmata archaeon]
MLILGSGLNPPGPGDAESSVTPRLPTDFPYKPYEFGDRRILEHTFPQRKVIRLRKTSGSNVERAAGSARQSLGFAVVRRDPAKGPGLLRNARDHHAGLVVAEKDLRWDRGRTLRLRRRGWFFIGLAVMWAVMVPLLFAGEYYHLLRFYGESAVLIFGTGPILGLSSGYAWQLRNRSLYWSSIIRLSYRAHTSTTDQDGMVGSDTPYEWDAEVAGGEAFILNERSAWFAERRITKIFEEVSTAVTVGRVASALERAVG